MRSDLNFELTCMRRTGAVEMNSYSRSGGGSRRGISANITPRGAGLAAPPPAKRPRGTSPHSSGYDSSTAGYGWSSNSSRGGSYGGRRAEERGGGGGGEYEFAGKNSEKMFPDAKTTLNNALIVELRRLNTKLDYVMERVVLAQNGVPTPTYRCTLELPYPERATVVGEGGNKKDAERRCAAAACVKLMDLGFMNQRGKKVEAQRHDITEDQKPKQLDVSMASQIQLFEAIAKLPECHAFPNWSSLKSFYDAQKRHIRDVPTESSGNAIYNLKLSVPVDSSASKEASGSTETVSQATTVVLPASWQQLFPVSVETPLALVPCPKCHSNIQISMSYVRKLENLLNQFLPLPVPEERNVEPPSGALSDYVAGNAPILAEIVRQMKERNTVCVFSGQPYSDLSNEEAEFRSRGMRKEQEAVERWGGEGKSLRAAARRLPISRAKNALLREINTKPVVVVMGMTGSGKTTQVPQFILENYIEHMVGATCNIVVTQPRRISAISIAERVAAERGEMVGKTVGYQVRLESVLPKQRGRILFCTTGILLMKLRNNPFLKGVSHVIVDEVHERDINSDFLLILLREIVRAGVGIKVILMSASVDAQLYVKYFMDRRAGITEVPCVNVEGHCYPVTEMYLDKICNLIGWRGMTTEDQGLPGTDSELVTSLLVYLTRTQPEGAILVFLPGWDDIMSVIDLLNHRFRNESQRYLTLPLHSMLSSRDQQSVFNVPPPGVRKIILATNIAESSVTIDDIVYVVNTGTVKVKMFDPTKKITHLSTEWSSKASVIQRRGRAGRCQPGHAYNLFTKEQFASMDDYQVPEMQRTPLEDLVLQAKLLNPCHKVANFLSQALDPPRASAISSAVDVLKDLGALDDSESLTPMGTVLAELPIEPVIGRLVLLGAVLGTLDPILTIAASMGHRDPFVNPPTKRQQADAVRSVMAGGCYSDHLLVIKAYEKWQVAKREGNEATFVRDNFLHRGTLHMIEGLRGQFRRHLEDLGLTEFDRYNQFSSSEPMVRAVLTAGLDRNVMKMAKMLESGGYRSSTSQTQRKRVRTGFKTIQDGRVFIHPSSVNSEKNFPSNWFVYYEKVKTSKVFIRDCTLISPLTLLLFAGRSLDIISEDGGKVVIGLDSKNWFSFEMSVNLGDLLRCGRRGVETVISGGLTGRLGSLSPSQRAFLTSLNTFLIANTSLTES